MFLTGIKNVTKSQYRERGRNPLKSGQCFLHNVFSGLEPDETIVIRRNPLKSGQCFLHKVDGAADELKNRGVAIPSNRVNVSYLIGYYNGMGSQEVDKSQSPQIGSMFLTGQIPGVANIYLTAGHVAIPSNRVNVSYSTHLFLRIIGNLTPPFREPHYFYAFFFPI